MPQEKLTTLEHLLEEGVLGYIWVLFISVWAGTVRYIAAAKNGEPTSFKLWLGEACTSAFVGVVTSSLCQYYKLDEQLSAAIVGIAAYYGTKTLTIMLEIGRKNINRYAAIEIDKDKKDGK